MPIRIALVVCLLVAGSYAAGTANAADPYSGLGPSPSELGALLPWWGKLVHRVVSPEQATLLRLAIANYRQARKLLRAWEKETERLIDAETTGEPQA